MEHLKPFDAVALLKPVPLEALQLTDEHYQLSLGLPAGTVGSVVEILPHNATPVACLVEFSDPQGRGYAFVTVPSEFLLALNYAPSAPMIASQNP